MTRHINKKEQYQELCYDINNCKLCPLYKTRINVVIGDGNINTSILLIGEAPGRQEDQQGIPFIGQAGKLLDRVLEEIYLKREKDIYITNVIKCRPPDNRNPNDLEIDFCNKYLLQQIKIIKPKVIVLLGNVALSLVTGMASGIMKQRGIILEYCSIPAIPIFHPAYVLRNPSKFDVLVSDFKKIKELANDK